MTLLSYITAPMTSDALPLKDAFFAGPSMFLRYQVILAYQPGRLKKTKGRGI